MVSSSYVKRGIVGLIIVGIFVLAFLVLKPIIFPIIFGLLLAYVFSPIYKFINSKIGGKNISAFLLMLGIAALVAIPVIYLVPALVKQIFDTYVLLQNFNFTELIFPALRSESRELYYARANKGPLVGGSTLIHYFIDINSIKRSIFGKLTAAS